MRAHSLQPAPRASLWCAHCPLTSPLSLPPASRAALMGSFFESLAYNIRGEDDLLNPAGAAALTGMLYKSAAGPRIAAMAAVGLGTFTAAATLLTKQLSSRGMLKNFL